MMKSAVAKPADACVPEAFEPNEAAATPDARSTAQVIHFPTPRPSWIFASRPPASAPSLRSSSSYPIHHWPEPGRSDLSRPAHWPPSYAPELAGARQWLAGFALDRRDRDEG
jgi:hypothetical protein